MKCKKLFCLVVAITVVFSMGLASATAADYPKRPITLICPWGAGGGTDAVSRIIATLLKKDLGVPVNVVNRTGGSGAVGIRLWRPQNRMDIPSACLRLKLP